MLRLGVLLRQRKVITMTVMIIVIFIFYKLLPIEWETYEDEHLYLTQGDYLIYTPKCRIFNLNPWNPDAKAVYVKKGYYPCHDQDILTEMVLDDNQIDVHIKFNHEVLAQYENNKLVCCISNVSRQRTSTTSYLDNDIKVDWCNLLKNPKVKVSNLYPTFISCQNYYGTAYENVHMPMALTNLVRSKLKRFKSHNRPLSVLILGIDSVSRLNMMRTMPHTRKLLLQDPNWLEFKIYQKMGDNTFPNLMAIFTGYNRSQAYSICKPTEFGGLNNCELIWKRYGRRNFITAYSEDAAKISSFNFEKPGFDQKPTDYYTRAYHVACSKLLDVLNIDGGPYCTGPEMEGERVWRLAKDFARLHRNNSYFGFFWTNSYSHDDVNAPSRMDDKVRDFMIDIIETTDENTAVIFLSDHGTRFGQIRHSLTGYIEERLPFLFMKFPKWFQEKYPEEYENIKVNTNRMVTPYDMYMTLQDILAHTFDDYTVEPALGCPKCHSLLQQVDLNRSCEDANITEHWCTCTNLQEIDQIDLMVEKAAQVAIDKLNGLLLKLDPIFICERFTLNKVLKAFRSSNSFGENANDLIVVEFETKPKAQFESTVHAVKMDIYGGFSRLDSYAETSKCAEEPNLKLFCYCKEMHEPIATATKAIRDKDDTN